MNKLYEQGGNQMCKGPNNWAYIEGRWDFTENKLFYKGPDDPREYY
ncbi:unnamed protein product [marine sediment metagenome]|uniref:Uncharacterized protein n=1 Tax=marine sediment metagenome TaxID=412755 RepID=X0WTG4_9ZZZZ